MRFRKRWSTGAVGLVATAMAAGVSGCGGGGGSAASPPEGGPAQKVGPFVTRVAGTAQAPVSVGKSAVVTGMAGGTISLLRLDNFQPPPQQIKTSRIAFTRLLGGNYDIYVLAPDGTNFTRVTNTAQNEIQPAISPDGSRIAFLRQNVNSKLYVVNSDGTNLKEIAVTPTVLDGPSWSPDGNRITFAGRGADNHFHIYLINADGTGLANITPDGNDNFSPSWSPEGSRVAYESDRGSGSDIYLRNANASGEIGLFFDQTPDGSVEWRPGTNGTFYDIRVTLDSSQNPLTDIYELTYGSSFASQRTFYGNVDPNFGVSPDAFQLAYTRGGNLCIRDTSGGNILDSQLVLGGCLSASWSGQFAITVTPQPVNLTYIGTGGIIASSAAGFLYSMKSNDIASVLTFDTSTTATRPNARIQPLNGADPGEMVVMNVTVDGDAQIGNLRYLSGRGPGAYYAAIGGNNPIKAAAGALVNYNASTGQIVAVLPYSASRAVGEPLRSPSAPRREGASLVFQGSFAGAFDASGRNAAPGGARTVRVNIKTGELSVGP